MENNQLNITLGELIKRVDELNSKLDKTKSQAKDTNKETTAMNTGFVAMNQAIQNLGSSVPALTSAFQLYKTTQQQVNVACQAFAANPVGATIQLISLALNVINTIIDKFKERIDQSDEATQRWNKAIAVLDPVLKGFNTVLGWVVDKFIDFVEFNLKAVEAVMKFGNAVAKALGMKDAAVDKSIAKAKQMADLDAQIHKDERKRIEERAKSEAKQGKLREQIATAEGEAKKKMLKDLADEIKLQTDAEIALNKKRIALLEYKQSLGPTSTAEKQALAELRAETDRLIGEQGRQLAKINKQIKSTNTEQARQYKTTVDTKKKLEEDAQKQILETQKKYAKLRNAELSKIDKKYSSTEKQIKAERDRIDQLAKLNGVAESTILENKKIRLQQDTQLEQEHYEKSKTALEESINSGKLSLEDMSKFKQELSDLETEHAINNYKLETEAMVTELEIRNQRAREIADTEATRKAEEIEAREQEYAAWEEKVNLAQDSINATFSLIQDNFDNLSQPEKLIIRAFEDLSNVWINMPKDASKVQKAMAVVGTAMQSATAVVNSYMAAKQQQIKQDLEAGKITEEEAKEEFEKTKKIQIAMATINMLQGIATAIATAMQLGPILGPIIGPINAAAVALAGALQIKNIKATTLDSGGSTGESPSIPSFAANATASPLLNEDFDMAQMNQTTTTQGDSATADQRVYIVEQDIQDSNRRVEIRETATTF